MVNHDDEDAVDRWTYAERIVNHHYSPNEGQRGKIDRRSNWLVTRK
jgi:hypothetical protein